MTGWIVVGAVVFLLVVFLGIVVGMYNGLVKGRNQTKNAWSQIDVQLKRRHDLVPNLVETVRGFATHERQTLENVIRARNQAMGASNVGDRIKAETELGGALSRLMVVCEQYPDLKANQNFLSLQEELTSTENKIGFARQFYNDQVMQFNTRLESFPTNVIGGAFQFRPAEFFQVASEAERAAPHVKF